MRNSEPEILIDPAVLFLAKPFLSDLHQWRLGTDLNEMLRQEFFRASGDYEYGPKELVIDIGKFVASLVPGLDTVVGMADEAVRLPSRFQRFKNRWLWFVNMPE